MDTTPPAGRSTLSQRATAHAAEAVAERAAEAARQTDARYELLHTNASGKLATFGPVLELHREATDEQVFITYAVDDVTIRASMHIHQPPRSPNFEVARYCSECSATTWTQLRAVNLVWLARALEVDPSRHLPGCSPAAASTPPGPTIRATVCHQPQLLAELLTELHTDRNTTRVDTYPWDGGLVVISLHEHYDPDTEPF